MMNEDLRAKLLGFRRRDHAKREELAARGDLFDGYHTEMEQVHEANAHELDEILDHDGWPTPSSVGEDAVEAAWMVATHAIGKPAFQRKCLDLLRRAVKAGEARPALWAALVDRIRFNERRPQIYGSLLDWDEQGQLSPWHIEDPEGVAERRRDVGLPPLEQIIREARADAEREGNCPPKPFKDRQTEIEEWARRVGWIE